MHNDVVGKWDSSLNIKLIHISYNLNTIWRTILIFLSCVCMMHMCGCLCHGSHGKSGSQRPSPVFSHLFEGSEVWTLAAKLVPQELYILQHLIGPSLKQFYTKVLAYIVFCLRPTRRGQLGIFFHTWAKFWIGSAQNVIVFFFNTIAYFSFCTLCNFKYIHFVTWIKRTGKFMTLV